MSGANTAAICEPTPYRYADGSYTELGKVTVLRWVLCDGMGPLDAARKMGCNVSSVNAWKQNPHLRKLAEEAGPLDKQAPAAPLAGEPLGAALADDDLFADLPPIGQDDPDDPSPEMLGQIANKWAQTRDPDACDRLAGWGKGVVKGWFTRAEAGDAACLVRVAILERAQEILASKVQDALIRSNNATALVKLSQAMQPKVWAEAVDGDNPAERLGLPRLREFRASQAEAENAELRAQLAALKGGAE